MLKLVSDENFNGDILRGLYRRRPNLDVMRVQDVGLSWRRRAKEIHDCIKHSLEG